jgi:nucleoid DNA-binding protein
MSRNVISDVLREAGYPITDATTLTNHIIQALTRNLVTTGRIVLAGFGVFHLVRRISPGSPQGSRTRDTVEITFNPSPAMLAAALGIRPPPTRAKRNAKPKKAEAATPTPKTQTGKRTRVKGEATKPSDTPYKATTRTRAK